MGDGFRGGVTRPPGHCSQPRLSKTEKRTTPATTLVTSSRPGTRCPFSLTVRQPAGELRVSLKAILFRRLGGLPAKVRVRYASA